MVTKSKLIVLEGGKTERFQQYDQYESKPKLYAYMSLPYVIYLNELSVCQNQQLILEINVLLLMQQPVFNILLYTIYLS